MKTSQRIQLTKTITWAAISMVITSTIGWLITGNLLIGLTVGIIDRIIKMGIYYVHERYWHKRYKLEKRQLKGLD